MNHFRFGASNRIGVRTESGEPAGATRGRIMKTSFPSRSRPIGRPWGSGRLELVADAPRHEVELRVAPRAHERTRPTVGQVAEQQPGVLEDLAAPRLPGDDPIGDPDLPDRPRDPGREHHDADGARDGPAAEEGREADRGREARERVRREQEARGDDRHEHQVLDGERDRAERREQRGRPGRRADPPAEPEPRQDHQHPPPEEPLDRRSARGRFSRPYVWLRWATTFSRTDATARWPAELAASRAPAGPPNRIDISRIQGASPPPGRPQSEEEPPGGPADDQDEQPDRSGRDDRLGRAYERHRAEGRGGRDRVAHPGALEASEDQSRHGHPEDRGGEVGHDGRAVHEGEPSKREQNAPIAAATPIRGIHRRNAIVTAAADTIVR